MKIDAITLSNLIQQLAIRVNVSVGFEAASKAQRWPASQTVLLFPGTVASSMDLILQTDNRYDWKEDGTVIDVFPKEERSSILDAVVQEFHVDQVNDDAAIDALMNTPEAHASLMQNRASMRTIHSVVGEPPDSHYKLISLTVRNETVRAILNKLLLLVGSKHWVFYRWGDALQYVAISM